MPQWLDYGIGAGEGLEKLLARMRLEEELAQRQQQLTETGRSNRADEALRGRQLDVSGQQVAATEALRQATLAESTRNQALLEQNRQRDDARTNIRGLSAGAIVGQDEGARAIDLKAVSPSELEQRYGPSEIAMQLGAPASLAETDVAGFTKQPSPTEVNQQRTNDRLLDEQKLRDERFVKSQIEQWNRMVTGIRATDARFNAFPMQVYDPNVPGGIGWETRGGAMGAVSSAPPMRPGGVVSGADGPAPGVVTPGGPGAGRPAAPPADLGQGGGAGGAGGQGSGPVAPPPAAERQKVDAYKTTLDLIADIEQFPAETWAAALGPFDSTIGAAAFQYGGIPMAGGEQGERLRTSLNRLRAQASFQEGGKQFTGTEAQLLNSFLALAAQDPATAKLRLDEFKRAAQVSLARMGVTGADAGATPAAAPGGPPRRRVVPDDSPQGFHIE